MTETMAGLGGLNQPARDSRSGTTVRGLVLPDVFVDLLSAAQWTHVGVALIREVMPRFEDPLIFLTSADHMRREPRSGPAS